jgi:hypothetical protein
MTRLTALFRGLASSALSILIDRIERMMLAHARSAGFVRAVSLVRCSAESVSTEMAFSSVGGGAGRAVTFIQEVPAHVLSFGWKRDGPVGIQPKARVFRLPLPHSEARPGELVAVSTVDWRETWPVFVVPDFVPKLLTRTPPRAFLVRAGDCWESDWMAGIGADLARPFTLNSSYVQLALVRSTGMLASDTRSVFLEEGLVKDWNPADVAALVERVEAVLSLLSDFFDAPIPLRVVLRERSDTYQGSHNRGCVVFVNAKELLAPPDGNPMTLITAFLPMWLGHGCHVTGRYARELTTGVANGVGMWLMRRDGNAEALEAWTGGFQHLLRQNRVARWAAASAEGRDRHVVAHVALQVYERLVESDEIRRELSRIVLENWAAEVNVGILAERMALRGFGVSERHRTTTISARSTP